MPGGPCSFQEILLSVERSLKYCSIRQKSHEGISKCDDTLKPRNRQSILTLDAVSRKSGDKYDVHSFSSVCLVTQQLPKCCFISQMEKFEACRLLVLFSDV